MAENLRQLVVSVHESSDALRITGRPEGFAATPKPTATTTIVS
jgi:5-enolpyruvylshikimate-3-phosphate synthase